MELVIISGQSGAGKSRVADILEDMSYYRVDNMPAALLTRFAELSLAAGGRYERVALVIDARERNGFDELFRALEELRALDCECRILYVEADTSAIIKRYKESRRPHPLAVEGSSLGEAVKRELELLQPVRARADYLIDTTSLTLGQLQKRIHSLFAGGKPAGHLTVKVVAFGFKYGLPMEADLVFDVRFLPNPYYLPELKDLSGLDARVAEFVFRHSCTREFMTRLESLIEFLLPQYEEEGKRELTVALGCTGGRHRSVAIAASLSDFIRKQGHDARLITRDIDKDMSRDAGRG
jgi:UPF0042 nucleotide-binding protein